MIRALKYETIFFSDRPKRIAEHMHTEDFVFEWQRGTGKESFHADPPNATLSILAEDEIVDIVVELKNPRLAGGALVYDIDVLEQDEPIPSEGRFRPGPLPVCAGEPGAGRGGGRQCCTKQ